MRFSKEPKIPRNAPCPCGSGSKYKKCCLKKQQIQVGQNGEPRRVFRDDKKKSVETKKKDEE